MGIGSQNKKTVFPFKMSDGKSVFDEYLLKTNFSIFPFFTLDFESTIFYKERSTKIAQFLSYN